MLNRELGFNLIRSEIFGLTNASETDLEKSKYLNGNLNNLSVTEDGFRAIKKYIDDPNNEIRFDMINGILATFAYGHPNLINGINDSVKQAILKEKDTLFCELDNSYPDLKTYLNQQQYQFCQSLMKMKISYDLVDWLANNQYFNPETILKKRNFYGLQNLLPTIASLFPKEFEEWYLKTKREDLKAVFLNSFLDFDFQKFFNNISKFPAEDFIESKIDVLRLYSILIKIGANKFGGGISIEKAKSLISETKIIDKEKLYLILYYFKYRRFDHKDEVGNKSLDDDIKVFSDIFNHLDKKIILEFYGRIDDIVLAEAIGMIKDKKKKLSLLAIIIYKLNSRFIKNHHPIIHDILKANLHGNLLKEFGEKRGKKLETLLVANLEKINEPYFHYRHNDLWGESISRAMYYLIMIFVFYHGKDTSKISFYKNKFLIAKGNFSHYLSKEFNKILDQIK